MQIIAQNGQAIEMLSGTTDLQQRAETAHAAGEAARDLFWRGEPVSVRLEWSLSEEDRQGLLERANRELAKVEGEMERLAAKWAKPAFVEKAPAAVVEKTRAQHAELGRQALESQHRAQHAHGGCRVAIAVPSAHSGDAYREHGVPLTVKKADGNVCAVHICADSEMP